MRKPFTRAKGRLLQILLSAGTYAKITLLFALLTGLLMLIGYVVGPYYGNPVTFVGLFLVLAAVFNFASYFFSDSLVIRFSKAKIIQESDNPSLFRIVRNVAQK